MSLHVVEVRVQVRRSPRDGNKPRFHNTIHLQTVTIHVSCKSQCLCMFMRSILKLTRDCTDPFQTWVEESVEDVRNLANHVVLVFHQILQFKSCQYKSFAIQYSTHILDKSHSDGEVLTMSC